MKRILDNKREQFIRDNYLKLTRLELAEALGVGKATVQSFLRRNKLTLPKDVAQARKAEGIQIRYNRQHAQPQPGDELLKAEYLITPVKAMAIKIGRSHCYVRKRLQVMGLVIPPEVVERNKQASRIKGGNVPKNKGCYAKDYMKPEAYERFTANQFKKGQKPHNTAAGDGEIRVRTDTKSGRKYKYIRVALAKWALLSRVTWEKHNGPIPDGMMVNFKDGDSLNCEIENLELISKTDNMLRNSASLHLTDAYVATTIVGARGRPDRELIEVVAADKELIETKRLQLLINRTIKKRRENEYEEQQHATGAGGTIQPTGEAAGPESATGEGNSQGTGYNECDE